MTERGIVIVEGSSEQREQIEKLLSTLSDNIIATDFDHLRRITDQCQQKSRLWAEVQQLMSMAKQQAKQVESVNRSKDHRSPELFRCLVGSSRGLMQVKKAIMQVAESDTNVMLLGESGTGKEVVARNIHYHSPRRGKPFVPINCGAIPAELLESELFGHEKGAFTGAIASRRGRFEMAQGGTLFLDEIGDMPSSMQVKLLRVLQERCFERVGSEKTMHSDVRIIAATHRDLEIQIEAGKFREDLYYRLCVFPITIPPLRERMEDLSALVECLLDRLKNERQARITLTERAMTAMCRYLWPGNVRELANLIERLLIMYPNQRVDIMDLPGKYRPNVDNVDMEQLGRDASDHHAENTASYPTLPDGGLDLKQHLADVERLLIEQALAQADGVVARAAEILRTRRTTLVEKIRKYKLEANPPRREIDGQLAINS